MSNQKYYFQNTRNTISLIKKSLVSDLKAIKRNLSGTNKRISSTYFNSSKIHKLHIGCGKNILSGWLNADLNPEKSLDIIHLDATKPFPFVENTFDYIFSEHMIEHISHQEGLLMLQECFRVLRPNGKIRIATPNLEFLVRMFANNRSDIEQEYLNWSNSNFCKIPKTNSAAFVINNFMRDWGHTFIYDENTLHLSLENCGFSGIKILSIHNSDQSELKKLENTDRIPEKFLKLETMVFEATK
jgi:predicted SAM-dependent methyltransferase